MKIINKTVDKLYTSIRALVRQEKKQVLDKIKKPTSERIVIVSNRLPVTLEIHEDTITYEPSSGGLVTGLQSFLQNKASNTTNYKFIWIGWPGCSIPENKKDEVVQKLYKEYDCIPVFIDESMIDKFYYGFCNKTIWPLFHYFQPYTEYNEENWLNYVKVNKLFHEVVSNNLHPEDSIWIHDYQLMLLPRMLRETLYDARIGFFLHIPFPAFELYRLLPRVWRENILLGLLGSDIIGFHTHNYVQYFLNCVLRILGIDHTTGKITYDNRLIDVGSFPMGIDFNKFNSFAKTKQSQEEKEKIKESAAHKKIILSLDRLDYTKGILERLHGFEMFLEKNKQWHGKIVLMMIIVPSRVSVDSYQLTKKQLDEEIGRINGKFTVLDWTPIVYQYKSISFESLVSLYGAADIALVTPLRDGMNLIAKEYLASKADLTGVLILSEMAGAAKELTEALLINPYHVEEIAQAIKDALDMPPEEQIRHNQYLQNHIKRCDVIHWALDFLSKIVQVNHIIKTKTQFLDQSLQSRILSIYQRSSKKILFIDYDGTLSPFASTPFQAKPTADVLELLSSLAHNLSTNIVIISGRDKATLEKWFGHLPITLAAEHGIWVKTKSYEWQLPRKVTNDWKKQILPILEEYTDRIPGTFIEDKDYSLSWHYRMADPEQYLLLKRELIDDLVHFTANIDLAVVQGNKVVEIRNSMINKGTIVHDLTANREYSFVMCIGDDATDEDMFKATPSKGFAIKVGLQETSARYYVNNYREVIALLKKFV